MESITSRTNPLITRIRKLTGDRKYRRREGVMVCEGPKMLAEALRWGAGLETILWQTGTHPPAGIPQGVRQVEVPGDLLRSVAPTETPQQVLFLARLPARALPEELTGSRYLVLDGLGTREPGNLVAHGGRLWGRRPPSAARLRRSWSPKTLRATMGACFRLPVWEGKLEDLLPRLARAGLPLYATALGEDTQDIRTLPLGRAAVVIGSEGRGVSPAVLAASEKTLQIPMTERCESLNAAAAGTVVLWQMGFGPVG
ncbi:MAG: TrmH family RNA methyltransferase [Evtepia gabavorous]